MILTVVVFIIIYKYTSSTLFLKEIDGLTWVFTQWGTMLNRTYKDGADDMRYLPVYL